MRTRAKIPTVSLAITALLLVPLPAASAEEPAAARLEGLVVGVDGRPGAGFTVHLIDRQGRSLSRVTAAEDGRYSFPDLPAGRYSLGLERPDGQVAPVAAPPVRVADGELARRDLKLVRADAERVDQAVTANHDLRMWFASLPPKAKAGFFFGLAVVLYGIHEATRSETDATLRQMKAQPPL